MYCSSGLFFCHATNNDNDIPMMYYLFCGSNSICTVYKQLLDEVFVISRIIKVEVRVISRSRRLRLITLTETLIILCVKPWSQGWLIAAGAYPGFCSMKRLEVFLLPLDGMLVHRRSLPRNFVRFPQQIAGTHLYTWVERGTVRVKCHAQEHNTLSSARARTRTARSGVERTH